MSKCILLISMTSKIIFVNFYFDDTFIFIEFRAYYFLFYSNGNINTIRLINNEESSLFAGVHCIDTSSSLTQIHYHVWCAYSI